MTNRAEDATTSVYPEAKNGTFGVEMHYNPEFLYYYLTHDSHHGQTISLDNNMNQITEHGYDIFRFATISLTSDLKVKSQPDWPDRKAKTLSIETGLWIESDRCGPFMENTIPALIDTLHAQGIDSDLQAYTGHGWLSVDRTRTLIVKGANPPCALNINDRHTFYPEYLDIHPFLSKELAGVSIIFPYPAQPIDLRSPADIGKVITQHAKIMDNVIRAFYDMEKKHLPMEKLVFTPKEPSPEEAKKYIVTCSYCNRDYSIVNGLACPGCSASKPIFRTTNT